MKKLLLATVLFLSVGLIASAQQKKSAVKPAAAASAAPAEQMLTADQQRNRKKLRYIRQQKAEQRAQGISRQSTQVNPKARETRSNSN